MCGICGIVGKADERVIATMTEALARRGPDDRGIAVFPEQDVYLGHRRLSVLDLSTNGRQPMRSSNGRATIVFNGEIYNFRELKEELNQKGHIFSTKTDTEVILAGYIEYGVEIVKKLRGMFAFCIYDQKEEKLFLFRDAIGIKPLYYFHKGESFIFASEIKSILASGLHRPQANWQAIYDYFTYLYVPCPETAFADISQLPPGSFLVFDLRTHQINISQYWAMYEDIGLVSDGEISRQIRTCLTNSVKRQMISDVPLGVMLSGGIDSQILTGLMAQNSSQRVNTFTLMFEDSRVSSYDERFAAQEIASRFNTKHHEIPFAFNEPEQIFELMDFFDQPFGNPTALLMYLISKSIKPFVTVALCGAGGDELFAGYPRYHLPQLRRIDSWLPRFMRKSAEFIFSTTRDDFSSNRLRRIKKYFDGKDPDFVNEFLNTVYFFSEKNKQQLFNLKYFNQTFLNSNRILKNNFLSGDSSDFGNKMLGMDVRTFLLNNILEYTDKMSMAVGLEVRVPYLDEDFVRLSLNRVPFDRKINLFDSKIILKKTFADLLTKKKYPKKGFNLPIAVWMRDGLGRDFVGRAGKGTELAEIFDWKYIKFIYSQHMQGVRDNSYELFSVMVFERWYRKHIL
ncbi:MAG TPA: asparagine synthase (glutamine-hydrolyzing) [Candidatus Omnitrophota bacterium]|nr:asparagine synthase (glutamine-hydrolyzing) [Candidatus Omnitrophota bacterium]